MDLINDLSGLAAKHARQPITTTPIVRFEIMRLEQPTALQPLLYEPAVCLVLQGRKRAFIGDRVLCYGPGDYFLAAAEVTAMGQIAEATPDCPYLALNLRLDPHIIAAVLLDVPKGTDHGDSNGFMTCTADASLLDAWRRMLIALDCPVDVAVLAPMIEREIVYRLLQGPSGCLLRQIAGSESHLASIRKAMAWIRTHFAERIRVEELADIAGMSASTFHKHFKSVTALSPIQYQKQIRLREARSRLTRSPINAAEVAYAIGYESPSQFNREYKRLFGVSPSQDSRQLRALNSRSQTITR